MLDTQSNNNENESFEICLVNKLLTIFVKEDMTDVLFENSKVINDLLNKFVELEKRQLISYSEIDVKPIRIYKQVTECFRSICLSLDKFYNNFKQKCYYKIISITNISGTPRQNIYSLVSEDFRAEDFGNNLDIDLMQKLLTEFLVEENMYYIITGLSVTHKMLKLDLHVISLLSEYQIFGCCSQ